MKQLQVCTKLRRKCEQKESEWEGARRGWARPHHSLRLPPPPVTTPVFLRFLGTLGTTLSYSGPEHFLRGAVPPRGPDGWPVAFTFSVCKARLSAEWQRHTLWSQTSLIPITALPSRSLAWCFFACVVLSSYSCCPTAGFLAFGVGQTWILGSATY